MQSAQLSHAIFDVDQGAPSWHCRIVHQAAAAATTEPPMTVLQDLSKPSHEQLMKLIQDQAAMIEALKASKQQRVSFKISPNKGCVMILGVGRMQPTLYASQWLRILDHADQLRSFIEANRSALSWKENGQ
jgi:hypothetical protein